MTFCALYTISNVSLLNILITIPIWVDFSRCIRLVQQGGAHALHAEGEAAGNGTHERWRKIVIEVARQECHVYYELLESGLTGWPGWNYILMFCNLYFFMKWIFFVNTVDDCLVVLKQCHMVRRVWCFEGKWKSPRISVQIVQNSNELHIYVYYVHFAHVTSYETMVMSMCTFFAARSSAIALV